MAPKSKSTPTIVQDCGWKVSLYATINQEPTTKIFSTFFTGMLIFDFFLKSCVVLKAVEMIVLCECYKELIVLRSRHGGNL